MRSRLSRPQQKQSKQIPKQPMQSPPSQSPPSQSPDRLEDDGQSFHTESVSVDPSVSPFEVVHKDSDHLTGGFGGSMSDVSGVVLQSDQYAGSAVIKGRTSSFSEGTAHSKMNLLRKQMGENRTKFERQQRDNREKKANMDEMKKKIDKLRNELEQRDEFIQSFEKGIIPQHSQPTTHQLCQQLLQKDAIVLGLTRRISELESLCQDQKEQLEEKDCIIDARTEAVALVTHDRDEKMLKMMEELEERQSSMRIMQEEFTLKEEEWNQEQDSLTKLVAEKSGRASQLEENSRRIESIRFELSTRNAELQERIVSLQSERKELKTNHDELQSKSALNVSEIKELKLKLCKSEAFGAKRLKNLEKQMKAVKQDGGGESGQRLLDLHNQIAVLEEEKGNLQLRLVDYDELKLSVVAFEKEVSCFKSKIDEMTTNLDEQLTAVSVLENEKILLVEALNDRELKLYDLNVKFNEFDEDNTILKNDNTLLNEKALELEENLRSSIEEQSRLQSKLEDHMNRSIGAETVETETRLRLEHDIASLAKQLEHLKLLHSAQEVELIQHKELLLQAELQNKETDESNNRLLAILTDKEDSITNQSIDIDRLNSQILQYTSQAEDLKDSITRLKLERDNSASTYRIEIGKLDSVISTKTREHDQFVANHRLENSRMNEAIDDAVKLRQKLGRLQDAVLVAEDDLANQKQNNARLNRIIEENKKLIENLENDVNSLENVVEEDTRKLNEMSASVNAMSEELSQVQKERDQWQHSYHEVKHALSLKENELDKLRNDLINATHSLEKCQFELEARVQEVTSLIDEKDGISQLLQREMDNKQESLFSLEKELHDKSELVAEYEREISENKSQTLSMQSQIYGMSQEISELNNSQTKYVEKIYSQDQMSVKKQELLDQLSSENENYKQQCEAFNADIAQKEKLLAEFELHMESTSHDSITYKHQLTEKEREIFALNQQLVEKEEAMRPLEEKLIQVAAESHECIQTAVAAEHQKWSETAEQAVQSKQIELGILNEKLSSKDLELSALTESVSVKVEEVKDMAEKLSLNVNEYEELKSQFEQLTLWYEQVNSSSAALQQQLEHGAQELTALQNTHVKDNNEIKELMGRIEALLAEHQQKEDKISSELELVEEKAAAHLKIDSEKQEEIGLLVEKNSSLQAEFDSLKLYCDELLTCQTKWEEWAKAIEEEKCSTLLKVSEYETSQEITNSQLQLKITELQEATTEKEALQNNLAAINTQLCESNSALETSTVNIRNLECKLSEAENELSLLRTQNVCSEHVEKIENLEVTLTATDQQITDLSDRLTIALRVSEEVKQQLKVKDDLVAGLEVQLSDERSGRSDESRSSSRQSEAEDGGRCRSLLTQLDEARLTITLLQTTLATCGQAGAAGTGQLVNEDLLGEVDLRDPQSSSPPASNVPAEVLRLQQTLAEKTQLVEEMQDQLRDLRHAGHLHDTEVTLVTEKCQAYEKMYNESKNSRVHLEEQIENHILSINDLNAKIKSLDGIISTLQEQVSTCETTYRQNLEAQLQSQNEEHLLQLQEQVSSLSHLNQQTNYQQTKILELETLLAQRSLAPEVRGGVDSSVAAGDLFGASVPEESVSSWFKPGITDDEKQHTSEQQTSSPEEASALQQESVPKPQEEFGVVADATASELQFKLAWYEEQWSTWTAHYNQLQHDYSESEARVVQLRKLLEERDEVSTPEPCPESESMIKSQIITEETVAHDVSEQTLLATSVDANKSLGQPVSGPPYPTEQYQALYAQYGDVCQQYQELLLEQQRLQQLSVAVSEDRQALQEELAALKQASQQSDIQLQDVKEKNKQMYEELLTLQQQQQVIYYSITLFTNYCCCLYRGGGWMIFHFSFM